MSPGSWRIPNRRWTRCRSSALTGPSSTRSGPGCSRSTIRSSVPEAGPIMAAAVRLRELIKQFGATRAVDRVSLAIEPGSIVALLGPSGCGKTTTLRMIAGLLRPDAGDIIIDGRSITDVPVHRRNVGMLFQNYALFPHMTVAENIGFGLETRK